MLLWSPATGAHGLATSAVGFMICRFILGLTEAANYPGCVKTTRLWFPAMYFLALAWLYFMAPRKLES